MSEPLIEMTPERRRELGSFYTPLPVATALARWAVRRADDTVLDPSYGGCAFFNAAMVALDEAGATVPARQIYGVDVDPGAKGYLPPLLRAGAEPSQFVESDFMEVTPCDFPTARFSTVIGNPPFIRYHYIPRNAKAVAIKALNNQGLSVSGRASYWAYFLLYSAHFLEEGGRLAMILPGAFLHTDYAVGVREQLSRLFKTVYVLPIRERLFEHTDEEAVVVCGDGAHLPNEEVRVGDVEGTEALATVLSDLDRHTRPFAASGDVGGWMRALLSPEQERLYDDLANADGVVRLRDVAVPRIGVVTGNNGFFVMSPDERDRREIPAEWFKPVVRKLAQLPGLIATDDDIDSHLSGETRSLLLTIAKGDHVPSPLQTYLDEGEQNGVDGAHKCQIRDPWYSVPHTETPPAFMHCMSASWPRIVVNRSRATCTNNIIRLDWPEAGRHPSLFGPERTREEDPWLPLALGMLSSLSQLSAELVGRSYGGGILKVEPGETSKLLVPLLPDRIAADLAPRVDTMMRAGDGHLATEAVDRALSEHTPWLTDRALGEIREARNLVFLRRRQHRADAARISDLYSHSPPSEPSIAPE
jgi:hypothetical protein